MTTLKTAALLLLTLPWLWGGGVEARPAALFDLTVEELTGKSFRFSWKQGASGGFNGILVLGGGGRIGGINSPNESSWELDGEGRLILKHEDGRISTTFEQHRVRDEKHSFEGPFHFREGIVHLLEETDEHPATPRLLDEGVPEKLCFTSQAIVCLDPGEEHSYRLRSGREVKVLLISVVEHGDSVVELIRKADVKVAIDGEEHTLVCMPYTMPSVIDGLRIQADTTSGWCKLPKRVQFSLWDANDPIVDLKRFGFPLRDYRLFAQGLQCYNEPVHLGRNDGDPTGAVFHHSYGIDFAGFEGGTEVQACVEGRVDRLLPDAILVNLIDETGLIWEYHHLDSIEPHLKVGQLVRKGEKIGTLGRSGPSGNFSHLHVGAFLTPEHRDAVGYTRRLNWYPWMVEAYRALHGKSPLAVPGPHQAVRVGETVQLDASCCIPGEVPIVTYRWELPDGTVAHGKHAETILEKPGVYTAALRVTDAAGEEDFAFLKIKAYSIGEPEPFIPTIYMTSRPTIRAYAGEPVQFKCWLHGAEDHRFELDFGDGDGLVEYESFRIVDHRFSEPGSYTVTASTVVDGMPTTARMKVVIQPTRAAPASEHPRQATSRSARIRDWMLQDSMNVPLPQKLERLKREWRETRIHNRESKPDQPVLDPLFCFVSEADAVVEERMIARVLEELGGGSQGLQAELLALAAEGAPGSDPRWVELYVRACELRRERRLAPLLARWQSFVFNQHRHVPGSWKYTEGVSDAQAYRFFSPGASLNLLELDGGGLGTVRTLIADRGGVIRNPDVSYDGQRVLFAWKKSDREDDYHLYELDLESREVLQLTEGLGLADYEGAYLPDGNIVFSSTRCIQTVDCNWVEVSNLFLMDGSGRFMRRVGYDQVHTIFPTVTDDGRVLYTRWDYNDRAQIYTQPLFQMNGDGTKQAEFYGGNSWFPTNLIHARKIPGSSQVVTIVTGHHTPAHGKLGLIDPAAGRQEGRGIQLVAPVRETEPLRVDMYGMGGEQFQYPYPLNEQQFLVTLALPEPDGSLGRFNLYFIDVHGRRELLVEGPESGEGVGCRQIVPLAPRPVPHVQPDTVDYSRDTGLVFIQDIHEGPGLEGVPRGTIERVRVVGLEYRCAGVGHSDQEGAGGYADVSTPIAVGNASWDVKVVYGSAKVHEDGSAFFEVPARKPLYFQALDKHGQAVQTMRSWTTLMPGEKQSCVGCHEPKNSAPPSDYGHSLATNAGPQQLTPFFDQPRGFSYTKDVQPILDRHCADCHDGTADVPYDLRGDDVHREEMKRMVARSYLELTHTKDDRGDCDHPLVNWIDCMSEPEMLPPYHRGAATSGLMNLLRAGHYEASLTSDELERIACWIDLLVPYCGDYLEKNAWSAADLEFYSHFAEKRRQQEELERRNIEALIEEGEASNAGD